MKKKEGGGQTKRPNGNFSYKKIVIFITKASFAK